MGRRKKEPGSVHREAIASAAEALFSRKGIDATSMDEIAEKSGYSKATLYVYFKNKEEIVVILALESMKKLHSCISSALRKEKDTRYRYLLICRALQEYQEEYPLYFKMILDTINIDFAGRDFMPEELETYRIGELLNEQLKEFINDGIREGELRVELEVMPTIFSFWGMLSGLIQTAANKEAYISRNLKLSRQEFLDYGYDTLYRSILKIE